jgi:ribosome-binding factor A
MDARRSERVAEALREELEELITGELTDPRIEVTSVIEVLVAPDARTANWHIVWTCSDCPNYNLRQPYRRSSLLVSILC